MRRLTAAAREDGREAVSEQGRLRLRAGAPRPGVTHLVQSEGSGAGQRVGYAQLERRRPGRAPAAELVVHPARRGGATGRALVSAARRGRRPVRVWAHGGHSAARHLAQARPELFRELRQLRRPWRRRGRGAAARGRHRPDLRARPGRRRLARG